MARFCLCAFRSVFFPFVFISIIANLVIVDGTSFWHFFNTWVVICRGESLKLMDFRRNFSSDSTVILRFPGSVGPAVTCDVDAPLRERVFHFSADAIREMKARPPPLVHTLEESRRDLVVPDSSLCVHKYGLRLRAPGNA
jgi:hypothetical protein